MNNNTNNNTNIITEIAKIHNERNIFEVKILIVMIGIFLIFA